MSPQRAQQTLRSGIELLAETSGEGEVIERQRLYPLRLRCWLRRGDPVIWTHPWGPVSEARLEDQGATLFTRLRVDRESMFAGLFYGVQGMRIGGTRKLRIAPHLAYGEQGVPGVIPPNAVLTVEVSVLEDGTGAELPER